MKPTDEHLRGETLLMFAEDALNGDEEERTRKHLELCPTCRETLDGLTRLVSVVRAAGAAGTGTRRRPCPSDEEIALYVEGTLGRERGDAMTAHLAECRACLNEVADIWMLQGEPTWDAPDESVERVLSRLAREPAAALVRWAGRNLNVLRGFGSFGDVARTILAPAPEPALARGPDAETENRILSWSDGAGTELAGRVDLISGRPTFAGTVTHRGRPASTVSVRLQTPDGGYGPESLDSAGRFGPWRLSDGVNTLFLTGVPSTAKREISLEIIVSEQAAP